MTKVLVRSAQWIAVASCLLATLFAQSTLSSSHCPQTPDDLYARLRTVSLDPGRVYHIRDASIDRPNLSLTFDRGTIAFTEDVCGHITGAFFAGDGEILLQPPNRVERGSLSLFTGMAILEEQFGAGYLRFNDDTAERLQPFLSPASGATEFLNEWGDTARRLAEFDAMRLLLDFSHFLPAHNVSEPPQKFPSLFHVHLLSEKFGGFEVFWDATNPEPLWAGQARLSDGYEFFDIWTSFSPPAATGTAGLAPRSNDAVATSFRIQATVHPPTALQASTDVNVRIRNGGQRMLIFELSRYLKVDRVDEADGHALAFIQNPAIQGTQLQRKGNDLVAVIFPSDLKTGQELKLRFSYAGEVLSDAGNGLLYVGARGAWYPSFGLNPASFDIEFRYPAEWTLLATGKQVRSAGSDIQPDAPGDKVSRWVSERPIPIAGFNLGKYVRAEATAGDVLVEAYSTKGVERSFPKGPPEVLESPVVPGRPRLRTPPVVIVPPPPSLVRDVQPVADKAARAIASFSKWYGPYPYSSLALTQMPGDLSQGWPGLVFLSSFAFLSQQEEIDLHLDPLTRIQNSQVLIHETAHQWWGDLVVWKSYHDQWLTEGLANYSAMLLLERDNPAHFREIMTKYRDDLLKKNKEGDQLRDAGPVTLGTRLISSRFPDGYDAIAYERGTWLFHMLRSMLLDSDTGSRARKSAIDADEPFFRALRKARDRYAGKTMSTEELMQIFEEELPRPLWYENRHKLDWFVDGWVNGTAIPELSSREIRITQKAGSTRVSGIIIQKDAPDDLVTAVPVYAETSANSMVLLGEVLADGHETPFQFTAPSSIRKVLIDPKQTVLAVVK